jgi:hypothetical protein
LEEGKIIKHHKDADEPLVLHCPHAAAFETYESSR